MFTICASIWLITILLSAIIGLSATAIAVHKDGFNTPIPIELVESFRNEMLYIPIPIVNMWMAIKLFIAVTDYFNRRY